MEQIKIPGTDLTVTTVGLGSSHFGTETDSATSFRILDAEVPEDALKWTKNNISGTCRN